MSGSKIKVQGLPYMADNTVCRVYTFKFQKLYGNNGGVQLPDKYARTTQHHRAKPDATDMISPKKLLTSMINDTFPLYFFCTRWWMWINVSIKPPLWITTSIKPLVSVYTIPDHLSKMATTLNFLIFHATIAVCTLLFIFKSLFNQKQLTPETLWTLLM